MIARANKAKTIDEYISLFPENIQIVLEKLRQTIRESAPEAEEAISYRVPTFRLDGNLVHFAAFRDHISFFPTWSGVAAFKKQLSLYKTSRGTVQFPYGQPIPFSLIRRIVKYRVKESKRKKKKEAVATGKMRGRKA